MKILLFTIMLVAFPVNIKSQEMKFGQITITPFIADNVSLDGIGKKLLYDKLNKIITNGEVAGGFDRRFVITPIFNVLSESTTATIPQKVSLKICFTFFIGDGVSGNLFGSSDMALVGIGDTYNDAVFSAIRKINTNDKNLQRLILDGKKRIVEYYNTVSSSLIDEAKCCMRRLDYETALSKIYTIPSLCDKYDIAQKIIAECSRKLLERNNNNLLVKARTVWCSNPNFNGAKEASEYISQICVTSLSLKIEIDKLTNEMKTRLSQIDNKKLELERAEISSLEEIKKEQIATSAKLATSFWDALPKIVYHIFNWF